MPRYTFKKMKDGSQVTIFATCDEKDGMMTGLGNDDGNPVYDIDGDLCTYDYSSHKSFRNHPGNWPMASEAAGVAHDQIGEAVAADKRAGIRTTDYTSDGRPIFTCASHRKEYCEAHGLGDRNGGYSDPRFHNR